jgi:hypothetical protein
MGYSGSDMRLRAIGKKTAAVCLYNYVVSHSELHCDVRGEE